MLRLTISQIKTDFNKDCNSQSYNFLHHQIEGREAKGHDSNWNHLRIPYYWWSCLSSYLHLSKAALADRPKVLIWSLRMNICVKKYEITDELTRNVQCQTVELKIKIRQPSLTTKISRSNYPRQIHPFVSCRREANRVRQTNSKSQSQRNCDSHQVLCGDTSLYSTYHSICAETNHQKIHLDYLANLANREERSQTRIITIKIIALYQFHVLIVRLIKDPSHVWEEHMRCSITVLISVNSLKDSDPTLTDHVKDHRSSVLVNLCH